MTVTYGITKEIYYLGSDSRTAYGIAAYADAETDGTAGILLSINDITTDKDKLQELVDACNRLKLSTAHLRDIVEDFLSG